MYTAMLLTSVTHCSQIFKPDIHRYISKGRGGAELRRFLVATPFDTPTFCITANKISQWGDLPMKEQIQKTRKGALQIRDGFFLI